MSEQINFSLTVDGIQKSIKSVGELKNNILELQKRLEDVSDVDSFQSISEEIKKGEEQLKTFNETTVSSKNAFKEGMSGIKIFNVGLGELSKSLLTNPIGLIITAFTALYGIFKNYQPLVDAMSTATNAFNIVLSDIKNLVTPLGEKLEKLFSNPKQALSDFGELIKNNIIERFNSALDMVGYLGSALKNVFTGEFSKAMDDVKNAGKEFVDMSTGVANTVDKVTAYAKATVDAANATTKLNNEMQVAIANNKLLKEQYDRQAEQQRQIRDNDLNSIEVRKKANEKLGEVLEDQIKLMKSNADLVVKQATNEYNLNKTVENKTKMIEAQAEAAGVLATIEGMRSEQKQNAVNLQKEELTLDQSSIDLKTELAKVERDALADFEDNEVKKLEILKDNLLKEREIEEERLKLKRDTYKKGTQAYADADAELQRFKTQSIIDEKKLDRDISKTKTKEANDRNKDLAKIDTLSAKTSDQIRNAKVKQAQADYEQEVSDAKGNTEKIKIAEINKANAIKEADDNLKQAKLKNSTETLNAMTSMTGSLAKLAGDNAEAQKAAALVEVVTNQGVAISNAAVAAFSPASPDNVLTGGLAGLAKLATFTATLIGTFATIMPMVMAQGGVVRGNSHAMGGVSYGMNTELEGGEGVINKRSMSSPVLRNMASQINQMQGGVSFSLPFMTSTTQLTNQNPSIISNDKQNSNNMYIAVSEIRDKQRRVALIESKATLR